MKAESLYTFLAFRKPKRQPMPECVILLSHTSVVRLCISLAVFRFLRGCSGVFRLHLLLETGATFQLLGISLAVGTLSQGVVLSHYAVFSFGQNLTAPCHFVSAKPFLCCSVFHDSSTCVHALFAFAFCCCASP